MKQLLALLILFSPCVHAQEKQTPDHEAKQIREYEKVRNEKVRNEAVEKAQNDVIANPDSAEAHFKLAEVYLHYFGGHDEQILAGFQRAIQLNPSYAEAYCGLAAYYSRQSDHKRQVEALHKAISVEPDYAEAYCQLGFTHLEKRYREGVKVTITEGEFRLAVGAFKRAVQIKPDYAMAYVGLGDASGCLKLYGEALEAFNQAVLLRPNEVRGHLGIGDVYIELGNKDAAMKEYDTLMKLSAEYEAQSRERGDDSTLNPVKPWAEILLKSIKERFGDN